MAVCDAYDALTNRPYQAGRTPSVAIRVLSDESGTQWDENLVDVFRNSVVDEDRGLRFAVPDLLQGLDKRGFSSLLPAATA